MIFSILMVLKLKSERGSFIRSLSITTIGWRPRRIRSVLAAPKKWRHTSSRWWSADNSGAKSNAQVRIAATVKVRRKQRLPPAFIVGRSYLQVETNKLTWAVQIYSRRARHKRKSYISEDKSQDQSADTDLIHFPEFKSPKINFKNSSKLNRNYDW